MQFEEQGPQRFSEFCARAPGLVYTIRNIAVAIRRNGVRVWRGKGASDPHIIADFIRKRAPAVRRVMFETGPLSVWFYHALRAEGLQSHAWMRDTPKRRLTWQRTKRTRTTPMGWRTGRRVGFFREIRVKGFESMLARTLVAARTRLVP